MKKSHYDAMLRVFDPDRGGSIGIEEFLTFVQQEIANQADGLRVKDSRRNENFECAIHAVAYHSLHVTDVA